MKPWKKAFFAAWSLNHLLREHVDVSENSGTPRSSIFKRVFNVNHPFWGTTIFGNTYVVPPFPVLHSVVLIPC